MPGAQFLVARAPALDEALFAPLERLRQAGVPCSVMTSAADDVLSAADVVITASGTATVQAALHGRPMVIVYRLAPLTFAIGRRFVRVHSYGMVNLVAGEPVVPELIQDAFTPESVARETVTLLTDASRAAAMRQALAGVRARLGAPGASARAAAAVLKVMGGMFEEGQVCSTGLHRRCKPVENRPVPLQCTNANCSCRCSGAGVVADAGRAYRCARGIQGSGVGIHPDRARPNHGCAFRGSTVPGQGVDSIATVFVENLLKGQASSFVYVRVPGGTIGSIRYTMVGAPTFKPGQRAIFFLKPGVTDTTYRPVGLTMGLYRIQAEPRTNRQVVQPPLVGGRTTAAAGPAIRGDVRRKLMPVAEFESLVRLSMATRTLAAPRGGR